MTTHTVLYRKYRSRDFSELIGQEHITTVLQQSLDGGRVAHAYLFTGPRGTGKTSAARILARKLNQVDDANQDLVDVIEIDAASNNGVDEIRELREKVHVAPNYYDYKVYIIDEVHMLSGAAFNALLKTLEEPPAHAVFVLATTEPHKLPQTIISRTQHFPFRLVGTGELVPHLQMICDEESIAIDSEALELIARVGEGSIRDSLSLLDQLRNQQDETVTVDTVRNMTGMPHHEQLQRLHETIITRQPGEMLQHLDGLLMTGVSIRHLSRQLIDLTRSHVRANLDTDTPEAYHSRQLLSALTRMPHNTIDPQSTLEATLLQLCLGAESAEAKDTPKRDFKSRVGKPASSKKSRKKTSERSDNKNSQPTGTNNSTETLPGNQQQANNNSSNSIWLDTLSRIKARDASLYGLLRNTSAEITDNTCVIRARFQFHYRRLQDEQIQQQLTSALESAAGQTLRLQIEHAKTDTRQVADTDTADAQSNGDDDPAKQVLDILGGEVIHG